MEKPIGVGDLVVLVRWRHTCKPEHTKTIFTVKAFSEQAACYLCGTVMNERIALTGDTVEFEGDRINIGYPVTWLKRIDPLTDAERLETEFDIALDYLSAHKMFTVKAR